MNCARHEIRRLVTADAHKRNYSRHDNKIVFEHPWRLRIIVRKSLSRLQSKHRLRHS